MAREIVQQISYIQEVKKHEFDDDLKIVLFFNRPFID